MPKGYKLKPRETLDDKVERTTIELKGKKISPKRYKLYAIKGTGIGLLGGLGYTVGNFLDQFTPEEYIACDVFYLSFAAGMALFSLYNFTKAIQAYMKRPKE